MKHLVLVSLFVLFGLSACKKETFTPCPGLEELYGEWESIDSDVPGYLRLGHKDFFEYRSSVDRDIKKRMTSCFEISDPLYINGEVWDGFIMHLEEGNKNSEYKLILFYTEEMDTVMFAAGAYNSQSFNNYRQMFVRKK